MVKFYISTLIYMNFKQRISLKRKSKFDLKFSPIFLPEIQKIVTEGHGHSFWQEAILVTWYRHFHTNGKARVRRHELIVWGNGD